jgi:hypothetical protein
MMYIAVPLPFATSAIGLGLCTLLYLVYKWSLPRPLPGIPYNQAAITNFLGDAAELRQIRKNGGRPRAWFQEQPIRHQSALTQGFLAPFSKPVLVLSDYREAHDILLRRSREFDRGARNLASFRGVLPDHHIAMRTSDPQFKANRDLVRDLMTPNFLNTVSESVGHDESTRL